MVLHVEEVRLPVDTEHELIMPQNQFFRWSLHHRRDGLIVVGGDGCDSVNTVTAEQEVRRAGRIPDEEPLGVDIRDVCNLIDPKEVGMLYLQGGALNNSDVPPFCQQVHAPISIIVGPQDGPVVWETADFIGQELTRRNNPFAVVDVEDLFCDPAGERWSRMLYLPQDGT